MGEIDVDARRIHLGDLFERGEKAPPPAEHGSGVEAAHLVVELLVVIGDRRHHAARMRGFKLGHHLGEELETDQEGVQRIVGKVAPAREDRIQLGVVVVNEAFEQRLRKIGLVAEMIEEPALGDLGGGDDLVDRRVGESLGQHGSLRNL